MGSIKLTWAEFNSSKRDHATIEHIYPNTPVHGDWPSFEAAVITSVELFAIRLGIFLPHRRAGMQNSLIGLSRRRNRTQKAKRAISADRIVRSRWRSFLIGHLNPYSTVG